MSLPPYNAAPAHASTPYCPGFLQAPHIALYPILSRLPPLTSIFPLNPIVPRFALLLHQARSGLFLTFRSIFLSLSPSLSLMHLFPEQFRPSLEEDAACSSLPRL